MLIVIPLLKAASAFPASVTDWLPVPVRSRVSKSETLSRSLSATVAAVSVILRVSMPSPPITVAAPSRLVVEATITRSLPVPPSMLSAPPPPLMVSAPAPPEIESVWLVPIRLSAPAAPATVKPLGPVAELRSIDAPAAAAFKVALPALLVSTVATKVDTSFAIALAPAATVSTSPEARSAMVRVAPLALKVSLPAPPVNEASPLVLVRMSA